MANFIKLTFTILIVALAIGQYTMASGYPSKSIDKPKAKYDRSNWKHWIDRDGDCINERHELLIIASKLKPSIEGCKVIIGMFIDPYSDEIITNASKMHIDHIVPLNEAYKSGGANWPKAKKRQFANDRLNLIAVSARENMRKGNKPPYLYLPPSEAFQCEYINRYVFVKIKYELTINYKTLVEKGKACGLDFS